MAALEFICLEAKNLPPKPVLAVKTGSVRRQVKLEVNHPFVVPEPGSSSVQVELALFQQLASQLLPDEGTAETTCAIPVRRPDGTASQVKLSIHRGASAASKAATEDDTLGVTKDYLDQHHLQQRVQGLIQDVLREQPQDPYRYMLTQLRKVQAGEETLPEVPLKEGAALAAAAAEAAAAKPPAEKPKDPEEPLVPRPPDKPKPSGARPAPAAGRQIKVQVDTKGWKLSKHVVRSILESPRVRKVGEASIRMGVAQQQSVGMTSSILERAREKAIKKALGGATPKDMAKVLVKASVKTAAVYLSKEYNRALTKWSISYFLQQAVQTISEQGDQHGVLSSKTTETKAPTPIVFLDTSASWAEWLSPASSKSSSPVPKSARSTPVGAR
eukprot:TRINITY_DN8299_c0_g1_i1.p1 TRINITY_DN8299_c0_g1~~TRINITY_DN8299_c0_g1_i1.p1  ORF type:complete len:405 (+),score=69.96 TRINITY_DN8299_c0_g1_i1:59-1216(+)